MIRIAAVADVHFGEDSAGSLRPLLEDVADHADIFMLAGDLTRHGTADEAAALAKEIGGLPIPAVGILGNHDHHCDEAKAVKDVMEQAGHMRILDGESLVLDIDGESLGIAGTKGFGGGFVGACASDFGEPEMKAFVRHTASLADRLEDLLRSLRADHKVALIHYAPCEATLEGERREIYPFLGSYLLAEAVDHGGADLVLHGHAHAGSEKGATPGGVPVRNVAQTLIRRAYNVYSLGD